MGQLLYDKASLVNIPSRYKEGKLRNIKPSNADFEFERGTGATRVNENGLIETFYGEVTNVLLQSNQFDTSPWTTFNAIPTPTSVQSGYDGTSDAWLLNATGASGSLRQDVTLSGVQTFSAYVKQGTADAIEIDCSITGVSVKVDLTDGSKISSGGATINTNIQSVGNAWYRISITGNGSATVWRMYVKHADNSAVGSGDNIYIQDAQLESGYFATPYIETTTSTVTLPNRGDTPRIDYTNPNNPSLLLEPQRTNSNPNSIAINLMTTVKSNAGYLMEVTDNYAISPDGTQNASRLKANAEDLSNKYSLKGHTVSGSSGTGAYTQSVYLKSNTGQNQNVAFYGRGVLQSVVVTTEWQRFYGIGDTISADYFSYLGCRPDYGSDTEIDILVYGYQIEQGSYATSYIPTNGGIETRNADLCIDNGNADTFNDSEGVLYAETSKDTITTDGGISVSDGTYNNRILFYFDISGNIRGYVYSSGEQANIITNGLDYTQNNKLAIKYSANSTKFFVNGSLVGTEDTSSTMPVGLNQINLHDGGGGSNFYGNVKALAYFPEALEDHELERLTSPTPLHASSFEDLANNNGYTIL